MSDTTYTSQATTAPSSGAGMSHVYNLSKAVHQLQTQLQGKWPTATPRILASNPSKTAL